MAVMLTRHHLIPRTRHNNKRIRRNYTREDLVTRIIQVCRPCHNHIHAVFSEKQLADDYNELVKLSSHPEIARFVSWIRDKPPGFKPRSFSQRGKRY